MHLFSLVFCVVRAVNKFDFRLVINESHNKMAASREQVVQ